MLPQSDGVPNLQQSHEENSTHLSGLHTVRIINQNAGTISKQQHKRATCLLTEHGSLSKWVEKDKTFSLSPLADVSNPPLVKTLPGVLGSNMITPFLTGFHSLYFTFRLIGWSFSNAAAEESTIWYIGIDLWYKKHTGAQCAIQDVVWWFCQK